MPKVSHAHRQSRRDQILDAALSCFATQGFQVTSMSDIIDASGLSAGAIYSYFPGKRDIAIAVARRAVAGQASVLAVEAESSRANSPAEIIRRLGAGFGEQDVPPSLILQLWGEAATTPVFFQIVSEVLAGLREGLTRALEAWAVDSGRCSADEAPAWALDVTPVILALAQGYIVQRALIPDFDDAAFVAGVERALA